MPLAIKINPADNVVVALHPIAKGTAVPVDNGTVTAVDKGTATVTAEVDGKKLNCEVRCIW